MKKRIRKTGEIVDVMSYNDCDERKRHSYDWVAYVDKNGDEWNVPMNFFLDFEDVGEELTKDIDWEQRRYEIAKDVFASIYDIFQNEHLEKVAVRAADALIAELKKGGNQ